MNVLVELQRRFAQALTGLAAEPAELVKLVRPAQDPRFGDYQANCAMPLSKQLGKSARDIATQIIERLDVSDLCHAPEIAGPGFINLKLRDEWLAERISAAQADERLGVSLAVPARTFVVDYSAPNVAKSMHVGHIRSTVIGDAICRTLRFLGHRVVSDNHVGDWGTQFGMVIYGYKHFLDADAYRERPVLELGRLYKLVSRLVDYHECRSQRAEYEQQIAQRDAALERAKAAPAGDAAAAKKQAASVRKAEAQCKEARDELTALDAKIRSVESDPKLSLLAAAHPSIGDAVLAETAQLHSGDPENRRLWEEFLPYCREDMQRLYRRLKITFDHELGESFYHDRLPGTVADLVQRGLARESEGAMCVFLDGFETPMIIRKKDGAFLYATTDLATIQYRAETWHPDVVLYVVDHRQSEHFSKLFATAKLWGFGNIDLRHISFGTVLGDDGKPYKTRSGDTVGLEGLLDEGVQKALVVVSTNDDRKPAGPEFSADERQKIASVVGIAALKYADLSQNRTSDYIFSYDKMLALDGNTAASMQYFYARVQGIFRKADCDPAELRRTPGEIQLTHPSERALALGLLRLSEAIDESLEDFRPNLITSYLYELTRTFSVFYESCSVKDAESDALRTSRLRLCDLAGRVIRQGLELLGIQVVDRM